MPKGSETQAWGRGWVGIFSATGFSPFQWVKNGQGHCHWYFECLGSELNVFLRHLYRKECRCTKIWSQCSSEFGAGWVILAVYFSLWPQVSQPGEDRIFFSMLSSFFTKGTNCRLFWMSLSTVGFWISPSLLFFCYVLKQISASCLKPCNKHCFHNSAEPLACSSWFSKCLTFGALFRFWTESFSSCGDHSNNHYPLSEN